jgi:hypothetical protein
VCVCVCVCRFPADLPKLKVLGLASQKVGVEIAIGARSFFSKLVSVNSGVAYWAEFFSEDIALPVEASRTLSPHAPDCFVYLTTYVTSRRARGVAVMCCCVRYPLFAEARTRTTASATRACR